MLRIRQRHEHTNQIEQIQREKKLRQSLSKKPKIKPQQWINLFKNNNSNKLKKHILNFFLIEGHYDIAQSFAKQANIQPSQIPDIDEKAINQRYQIVKLIKQGQIDEALQKIQQFDTCKILYEQLDDIENLKESRSSKVQIIFCLKGLKVINLIKENHLKQAIIMARKQLIPFLKIQQSYMAKIQQIMSLLVFPNVKQCSSYYLTTAEFRNKISSQINAILLQGQDKSGDMIESLELLPHKSSYANLSQVLKLTKWLEKRLESYLQFPKINLQNLESQKIFQSNKENN